MLLDLKGENLKPIFYKCVKHGKKNNHCADYKFLNKRNESNKIVDISITN